MKYSDKKAVSFPGENIEYTYKEMYAKVKATIAFLRKIGVNKGDHIGIIGENQSQYLFVLLACCLMGSVFVTFDNRWTNREICNFIGNAEIDYLFWLRDNPHDGIVGPMKIVTKDELSFKSETKNELPDLMPDIDNEQLYSIQFTSGTGGKPKAAMITRNAALNAALNYGHFVDLNENEVILLSLPFSYCYCNILNLLAFWNYGCHIVICKRFKASLCLEMLEKYKCSCMCGVPAMFLLMIEQENFANFDLSNLDKILIGGDYCAKSVAKQISSKFGAEKLTIGYGLTEATSLCMVSDFKTNKDKRMSSIGTLLPDLEAKIVAPDGKQVLGNNQTGELFIRGWSIMKGYYKDKEETKKVLSEDGWLRTGDLVYKDSEGYFHYSGRCKDMIIRAGCNVSPVEIENVISEVEGIQKVSVVGIDDEIMGEEIIAFISSNENDSVIRERVLRNISNRLSRNKIPKYIFVVDNLSLSSTGKVLRSELKKKAVAMISSKI